MDASTDHTFLSNFEAINILKEYKPSKANAIRHICDTFNLPQDKLSIFRLTKKITKIADARSRALKNKGVEAWSAEAKQQVFCTHLPRNDNSTTTPHHEYLPPPPKRTKRQQQHPAKRPLTSPNLGATLQLTSV